MIGLVQKLDPDRVFPTHTGHKIKLALLVSHILFFVWLFSNEFSWTYFLFVTPFLWFFIGKLGMEIGYHRYFTHRSFTASKPVEMLLHITGIIATVGSPLSWAGMHRAHHRLADQPGDPQNSRTKSPLKIWLTFLGDDWHISPSSVKDLMRDPTQRFIHRHYFKIVIAYIAVWAAISWYVNSLYPILTAWVIPSVSNFTVAGFLNGFFHRQGKPWKPPFSYRNFDTNDNSLNSPMLWMMGSQLHNNHHAYPTSSNFNVYRRWSEADFSGWFIKHFLATEVKETILEDTNVR